jgi:hypothetical protein
MGCTSRNLPKFDICAIPRDTFNLCVESTLLGDMHCGGIHRETKNQRRNDKRESDGLHPFLVELHPCLDRVRVSRGPFLVELHPCLDRVLVK